MKKCPSLVIIAIAAISIQCSIANNNLSPIPDLDQVSTMDGPMNERTQAVTDSSIERSPLIKIIQQMDAFLEDLEEFEIETRSGKGHTLETLITTAGAIKRIKILINSVKQCTIKFLQREEDINSYLYFLLQERIRIISTRHRNINICAQGQVGSVFFYPTSLAFFKFLNNGNNNNLSKERLRINKQARMKTVSVYEFFQLLIKETLLLCDIESLNKKTIDILRASAGLHDLITNPDKQDLGHPDEVVAPYYILESILMGYPKPIKNNKQLPRINKEIKNIKKEINFEQLRKNKAYINNKNKLIHHLIPVLFSKNTPTRRLSKAINYLSKDLDNEIVRNHFYLNEDSWELDEKSNYVQSKWPYPLPKPVFLEKVIAKYGADPMPIKVVRLKPNVRHPKNLLLNTKKKKKKRPDNCTTIHTFTNAALSINEEPEKKEKVLESIDTYSRHIEQLTNLPSITFINLESLTDEGLEKTDVGIIPSQPLQEKGLDAVEPSLQLEDSTSLPSIIFTDSQSPTDEIIEKEDYSIYYDDYNEYKNSKNNENKTFISDSEKNIIELREEAWKQPSGARRFNSNLLNTRATDFPPTTHQEIVNKIFDPKRQCKVKFSEFVTLWKSIGGRLTGNMHGGSHRKIIAPDGKVVTGIFTHGNGTMYGKKSIQYLKMALEYVGLQPEVKLGLSHNQEPM